MSQNNINIDELKKMATNISYDQLNNDGYKNNNYMMSSSSDEVGKIISNQKHVTFNKNVKVNMDSLSDKLESVNISSNMTNMFGYTIPTHTFYLFLVLLTIGCTIWYMSKDTKNKKKNDHKNEEQ